MSPSCFRLEVEMASTTVSDTDVIERYRASGSVPVVAREFGIGPTTVYRILNRAGVSREKGLDEWRRKSRAFNDESQEVVKQRYEAGESYAAIARDFHVSLVTVRKAVLRAGVSPRRRGRGKRFLTDSEEKQILGLRKGGLSQEAVARSVGVSQPLISRILRQHGESGNTNRRMHSRFKGGRVRAEAGYWQVLMPYNDPLYSMANRVGYVPEHRLVLARHLGRPLTSFETVHHINGDRTDNRLENLQLRQGRHGKGTVLQCLDCGSANVTYVPIATED